MVIQAIALLDTLDRDINTFVMRVREWYSWHFPELIKIVPDNYQYSRLALLIKNKSDLTEAALPGASLCTAQSPWCIIHHAPSCRIRPHTQLQASVISQHDALLHQAPRLLLIVRLSDLAKPMHCRVHSFCCPAAQAMNAWGGAVPDLLLQPQTRHRRPLSATQAWRRLWVRRR